MKMRNCKKFTLIGFVVLMSVVYASQALASIQFANIQVFDIENGAAKVKWSTPGQQTRGIVYFGESSDDLSRYIGHSLYNYYHEAGLTGLKKNKKYYFKIVAIDRSNNEKESFIQSFSTRDMKRDDLKKPEFKEQKILQITNNAVALSWTTNEETSAIVSYGIAEEALNKTVRVGSFKKEHELFIYNLKQGTRYNLKIVVKDKAGNEARGKYFVFNTGNYEGKGPDLFVKNIEPLSFDEELVFSRRISIIFKTNLVAKSIIQYGTASGRYRYRKVVSESHQLTHQIALTDLEPDTTYYYKITASSNFYNKRKITSEMAFKTKPLAKKVSNGSLVKSSGYKVYVISGNEKLWIESADVFDKLGYKWDWIQAIDNVFLNEYKEGRSIKTTSSHSDGTLIKYPNSHAVYLIENRKKRPFSSAEAFIRNGYSWDRIITISRRENYRTGEYL
ncbi:MAG: hypothetical protein KAQ64_02430 [Candidatus Pacebacteria bacterium]|nr:hypothetical protein [Candidatus Paceibacterota bacterium]